MELFFVCHTKAEKSQTYILWRIEQHRHAWVSDRPSCLTFCGIKMSKNAEWESIRNIVFSSVSGAKLCWGAAWLRRRQRYNTSIPFSKFFRCLISHLESLPHLWIGIQPFTYGHSCAFSTREKKWNRDITFYLMPIIKTYEAATFDLPPMLQPPHLFATDPS